jgi:hypothetical protein
MIRFASFLLLLLCSALASAQVYKWVDKDGKVQYSDQPPPNAAKGEKAIAVPKSPPSVASPKGVARSKSAAELDAEFRKRSVEREEGRVKQDKEAADEKQREAQCASAKSNLAQLESGTRIAKYDEKGERYFLEDENRPRAIEEARKAADSWCNAKR